MPPGTSCAFVDAAATAVVIVVGAAVVVLDR